MSSVPRATSISTAEFAYTLLDVFTDAPLTGNPLAVVHDADLLDDKTMLAFACETRLAETTFVQSPSVDGADYRNRIFSMAGELPFAGHPSLGTAVGVARARGATEQVSYVQQTQAGLQRVDVKPEGRRFTASMLQEPAAFGDEVEPRPLLSALGLDARDGHARLRPQVVATGLPHVMLPLASREALKRAAPDAAAVDALLEAHEAYGMYAAWPEPERGTARARMFGRTAQVIEDAATGSAAGPLCAYVHRQTGCVSLDITQGAEIGRPSRLLTEIAGQTVRVTGGVVVVIDGVLRL